MTVGYCVEDSLSIPALQHAGVAITLRAIVLIEVMTHEHVFMGVLKNQLVLLQV